MAYEHVDFPASFAALAAAGQREQTTEIGGINVRLVRVPAGSQGTWDRHDDSTETVVVWSGDFTVDFRDASLPLTAGQCCVVPVATDHKARSVAGAEVVLYRPSHKA